MPTLPLNRRAGWRAVIITAIPVEFLAVRGHLRDVREVIHPGGTIYEVGTFGKDDNAWFVAVAEVGAGNDVAALEAERAIQHFDATHALFVGVAGGLKDVHLGDVVAATSVYGYESGKDADEFRARPSVGESSHDMVQRARVVARTWSPASTAPARGAENKTRAFVGPIAAGAKVVASSKSETAKLLRQSYGDALAVEMEGRGFLRATHATPNLRALVVRGISDLLDSKAEADAAGWQELAARHAAHFAFAVLEGLLAPIGGVSRGAPRERSDPSRDDAATPMFEQLNQLLQELYPQGPLDRHIWERAGGDLAAIELGGSGRSAWFGAVRHLKRGGGGASLTSLLQVVASDFPENPDVSALIVSVRG